MNSDWSKLQEIFDEAWALDADARRALIAQRCAGNEELRAEVERMLRAFDEESQSTFKSPGISRSDRFGVWQTGELLGRGGMAEVYLAHRVDGQLEQRAALKVMSPYFATPEYIDRFRRERQLLARLEHPNIARLLDGGVSQDGEPYLVMEYVEGQRLDDYCDSRGLAVAERVKLIQRLCLAVESAHRNLVLHRDIKPSNVLVTSDGTVKLLDFGAARELDSANRETRAPLTPAYASPEQLRDEPVTTLSDVYGLGATLYRLLAGIPPFGDGDQISFALFRTVLEDEPPLSSASSAITPAFARELRGDLDNVVRKAMDKNPARRYASAERFSADLGRWLESRPVEARPRTWGYRAERFVTRNRWGVALALALLLTLAGAAAAIGWHVRQEQETARRNARLTDFLTRVMGLRWDAESSPIRAHGRATRMVEVIRYAGERLDAEMVDQPQLQARLYADIGHALSELAYCAEAERSLQKGLQLADPRKDPLLAGELTEYLGRTYFLEGSVRTAEKKLDEALPLIHMSHTPAAKAVEHLLLPSLISVRMLRWGVTPEVERLTERCIELGREIGEQTPAYAISLNTRALVRLAQGRTAEAEDDDRRALAIQEKMSVVPLEHGLMLNALVTVRASQGKVDEAARLLQAAMSSIEEPVGRDSLYFVRLRISHGELRALQHDLEGAAKELAEVDHDTARVLPKALWMRIRALLPLSSVLMKLNHPDEARSVLEQALALAREEPGEDSPLGRQVKAALAKMGK